MRVNLPRRLIKGRSAFTAEWGNSIRDALVTLLRRPDAMQIVSDESESPHPWKVTSGESGYAAISSGSIIGYYMENVPAAEATLPNDVDYVITNQLVMAPIADYSGGSVSISGTQYVYVESERENDIPADIPYSDAAGVSATNADGYAIKNFASLADNIHDPTGTQTITIVADATDPKDYIPTSGMYAVCIAKVTNTDGVITVDNQYIHHNPTIFLPILQVDADWVS